MKKILFLSLMYSITTKAQLLDKNVYFGLLGTGNATVFHADPSMGKISPDYGYGLGAFLRLRVRKIFTEFELGYSDHKVMVAPDIQGSTVSTNYSLSGLDLSAQLGWRVLGIGKLGNLRIFAGYNYCHYSEVTAKSNGAQKNNPSITVGNSGVVIGTGIDIWKIVLNVKYIYGISNLSNTSGQDLNSRSVGVSLGYKF